MIIKFALFSIFMCGCSGRKIEDSGRMLKVLNAPMIQDKISVGVTLNNLFQGSHNLLDDVYCDTILGGTLDTKKASFSLFDKRTENWITVEYEPRYLVTGDQMLQIMKGGYSGEAPKLVAVRVIGSLRGMHDGICRF